MTTIPVLYINYKYTAPAGSTVEASLPITIEMPGTMLARPTLVGSIEIPISIGGNIMRGAVGDIAANLSVPISFGGTINYVPPVLLSCPIPIVFGMAGEIVNFYSIYCWGGDVVLPVFTVSGNGIVSESGIANINFPLISVEADGIVSTIGDANIELPIFSIDASGKATNIGTADIRLPQITIDITALISGIGETNIVFPMFTVSGDGIVGAVGSFDRSFPAMRLDATALQSITGEGDIVLPIFTLETLGLPTTAYLSMVMNLKNRALTLYDNYDFNSLCRFKDKHFGATKTGIYDLDTGTTDAGTLIDWNFRTGYLDLEQKNKKKLKQAWLSYKTDGDLILTVIQPNGDEYEYSLQGINETETGLRVKFGKGIKSKYVALDIRNVDGSTITLDTLKLHFDKLSLNR